MREPLEMVTTSLMQNMVQIRKKNTYFVTKLLFIFGEKVLLGLSALRAPTVGHVSRKKLRRKSPHSDNTGGELR